MAEERGQMAEQAAGDAGLTPLQKAAMALREMRARLDAAEGAARAPIAIIGVSGRFPGAANCDELWQLLDEGRDAVTEIPEDRWPIQEYHDANPNAPGKMNTRRGGFVDGVDQFDPGFFGISQREAAKMDPQQRMLLEVAWEALENAGQSPRRLAGSRTGTYIGINQIDYALLQIQQQSSFDIYSTTGNGFCFAAGRLSFALGLNGPNMAVDTACSSSLVAVHLACQALRARECDAALAGGVQLNLIPTFHLLLAKTQSLSPSGRCATFDASADGLVLGEGCGIIVLKRLTDAVANRDRVLAVLRGSGVSHGGASSGITVPSEQAQESLLRQVLEGANVRPDQVDYVETHGTATKLGDPIEVGAITSVFRDRQGQAPVVLGAAKTNIGHLDAAAGIAGLIKVVLSLQHERIPRNLHFEVPNPQIEWDEQTVRVPTAAVPWKPNGRPRLAGVSSFGISGTNAHMLIEEAPAVSQADGPAERTHHLLTLSARTPAALDQLAQRYDAALASADAADLPDICFTAGAGRSHFEHRLAVVGDTPAAMRACLAAAGADDSTAATLWRRGPAERGRGRIRAGFHFGDAVAGEDATAIDLYSSQSVFRRMIDRCSEAMSGELEGDLKEAVATRDLPVPADPATRHAAALATHMALSELWQSWGLAPAAVSGHGVGELAAACVAGAMSLEEALQLAVLRAGLVGSTINHGSRPDYDAALRQATQRDLRLPLASASRGRIVPAGQRVDAEHWLRQTQATGDPAACLTALDGSQIQLLIDHGPAGAAGLSAAAGADLRVLTTSPEPGAGTWQALLSGLGQAYVLGLEIDWEGLDQDYPRQRRTLPTYPFQRQRFWLADTDHEARSSGAGVDTKGADGSRAPASGHTQTGAGAPIAVSASCSAAGAPLVTDTDLPTGAPSPDGDPGAPQATDPGALKRLMARQLQAASEAISQVVATQLDFLGNPGAAAGGAPSGDGAPPAAAGSDGVAAESPASSPAGADGVAAAEPEATSAGSAEPAVPAGWHVLLLSAADEEQLEGLTDQVAKQLQQCPEALPSASRSMLTQTPSEHCRALVCRDGSEAAEALGGRDRKRVLTAARQPRQRSVAFMLPGVGDQYINMGLELYQTRPVFRDTVDHCCELARQHLGEDLREILYPAPDSGDATPASGGRIDLRRMLNRVPGDARSDKLAQTRYNQPAVFIIEYALAQLWQSWGLVPQAMLGYSVGEYVAACLAGVMSLGDAVLLLSRRAQLIQELPEGAMLAVPKTELELTPLLGEDLSIAIISTPGQCVVAGPPEAVSRLEHSLADDDVVCRRLATTHAFHSHMLTPLREPLTEVARSIHLSPPQLPFISNVTGTWITSSQATDPHYWAQHTCSTVRFSDGVGELLQTPGRVMLEVGPGQNLGSFVFQHPAFGDAEDCQVLPSLRNSYDGQSDTAFIYNTLVRLWLGGIDVPWPTALRPASTPGSGEDGAR